MNSFSFSEDDEPRQLHCLDQEIGEQHFGDWRGNSQEQAEFIENEPENTILSEFDINIPAQNNQALFDKPSLEHIERNPQPILEAPQKQEVKVNEKEQQTVQTSFQEAHTFFQQTNISTTIVGQSGIQQRWSQESAPTLNEFVSLAANIYSPMIQNLKIILQKTKGYSDKTISNMDMYCLFLRIKLQQQQERLRIIKRGQLLTCKNLKDNELVQGVYIDQKIILTQITIKNQNRKVEIENYCEALEESCNKVKLLLSKALENRTKKIEQIASQIERIERIHNELTQMFNSSEQHQYEDWISKGDLRADRYLQRKYLQEREKLFLNLLKETGQKIVTLLHSIFLKQEPIICAVLSKQMFRYRLLNDELYKIKPITHQNTIQTNMIKITSELAQVLAIIIPVEWREQLPQDSQNQCQILINQLHSYLQNQIFFPTVQISTDLILFKETARWISKKTSNQQINHVRSQNKQNKDINIQGLITCQNLVSQKSISISTNEDQNMTVNVVLTSDRYLHLQHQQKIASLKLKRLKLSKKGNQTIILSEKHHNLTSLFVTPLHLGELTFPTEIITDKFITAVLSAKK